MRVSRKICTLFGFHSRFEHVLRLTPRGVDLFYARTGVGFTWLSMSILNCALTLRGRHHGRGGHDVAQRQHDVQGFGGAGVGDAHGALRAGDGKRHLSLSADHFQGVQQKAGLEVQTPRGAFDGRIDDLFHRPGVHAFGTEDDLAVLDREGHHLAASLGTHDDGQAINGGLELGGVTRERGAEGLRDDAVGVRELPVHQEARDRPRSEGGLDPVVLPPEGDRLVLGEGQTLLEQAGRDADGGDGTRERNLDA